MFFFSSIAKLASGFVLWGAPATRFRNVGIMDNSARRRPGISRSLATGLCVGFALLGADKIASSVQEVAVDASKSNVQFALSAVLHTVHEGQVIAIASSWSPT